MAFERVFLVIAKGGLPKQRWLVVEKAVRSPIYCLQTTPPPENQFDMISSAWFLHGMSLVVVIDREKLVTTSIYTNYLTRSIANRALRLNLNHECASPLRELAVIVVPKPTPHCAVWCSIPPLCAKRFRSHVISLHSSPHPKAIGLIFCNEPVLIALVMIGRFKGHLCLKRGQSKFIKSSVTCNWKKNVKTKPTKTDNRWR